MGAENVFRVEERDGRCDVVDDTGAVAMTFSDPHSAGQLAALLNQTFERGRKQGFRDAQQGRV